MKIYLDMDGVLADFDGRMHLLAGDKKERLFKFSKKWEMFHGKTDREMWGLLKSYDFKKNPNCDLKKFKNELRAYRNMTYSIASEQGFFSKLEKLKDADELYNGVVELTKTYPAILTSPIESSEFCAQEKREWINKYYPLSAEIIVHAAKEDYANSTSILIDDTPKKVNAFINAGGIGILHKNAFDSLNQLQRALTNS